MASWADEFDIDDSDILGALNNRRKDPSQLASPPWPPVAGPLPPSPPHQPLISSSADPHRSIAASAGLFKRFQKPRPSQKGPSPSQNPGNITLDLVRKRKQGVDPVPSSSSSPLKTACRQSSRLNEALWRENPGSACRKLPSQIEEELCIVSHSQEPDKGFFACKGVFTVEEHCQSLSSHGLSPTPASRRNSNCYRNVEFYKSIRDEGMMSPPRPDKQQNFLLGHGKASTAPPTAWQTLKQNSDLDKVQQMKAGIVQTQERGCDTRSKRVASMPTGVSQQEHNQEDMVDQQQLTVTDRRPLGMRAPLLQKRAVPNTQSDAGIRENTGRLESRSIRSLQKDLHYQIPGPAGTVQRGLGQKSNPTSESNRHGKDNLAPCRASVLDDSDFQSGAWLKAKKYTEKSVISVSTIRSIKASRTENRIPKLLAVIKTCIPNGCGDVMVTLKDHSDFINGTVHRRVMSETEFGRIIEPGAVILLHQVAVFSPTPFAHYLNITINNVEQVFAKGVQFLQGESSRAAEKAVLDMTGDEQMDDRNDHPGQFKSKALHFCAQQTSIKNAQFKSNEFLAADDDLEILLGPLTQRCTTQERVHSQLDVPATNIFTHAGQDHLPSQPNSSSAYKLDMRNRIGESCLDPMNDGYDQLLDDTDLFPCIQPRSAVV